jgi:hypothetical protein
MCVITDPNQRLAAEPDAICSLCNGRLEMPYLAWMTTEMWPEDERARLPLPGSVIGHAVYVCQSCCLHIRSGFLEDMEQVCELTGHPRRHETIHSLRRWQAAGGGWRPGLLS